MKLCDTLALLAVPAAVIAGTTFSPARPPAIPLAVKSPYVSAHLTVASDGGDGGYLAEDFPRFWQ
jgi:hypothetical protein